MEPPSIGMPADQVVGTSDTRADLRRAFRVIRARLPALVGIPVLAASMTLFLSGQQPKVYEAQTTLIVGQSLSAVNPEYTQLLASQRLSTTYAEVATTWPLLERVIGRLDLRETAGELARRIRAEAAVESSLLTVTAQDVDPARASAIADAIAEELIATSRAVQGRQAGVQETVDKELDATQDQIRRTQERIAVLESLSSLTPQRQEELRTLQAQLVSLRATYAGLLPYSTSTSSNQLSVIQPALTSDIPISPRPLVNTMLAAVVALLITACVAYILNHLDDTVKDSDDVQEVAGLPTLGRIMRFDGARGRFRLHRGAPLVVSGSPATEAYRTLRTNIDFAGLDPSNRTLLITSAVPAEGKTVTAANLAIVFSQAGRRVLLIDANLRTPGVHTLFGLPNGDGLTTILGGDGLRLEAIAHETKQKNLRVLTSGPLPPDPGELLGSPRMRAFVDNVRAHYDLVIFDSPPLHVVTDAAILGSFLEATVLVVHQGHTRQGSIRRAREALVIAGARVVGAVLNRIPKSEKAESYDYSFQYHAEERSRVPADHVAIGTPNSAERSGP